MPIPPVAVEIAPADSPIELRQLLLDACSRAVENTTCVEASAEPAETPVVVAIVSWRDPNNVRLEVALRLEKRWMIRDVTFGPRDDPTERWRAAGLVIGTLASVVAGTERGTESANPPAGETASGAQDASDGVAGPPGTETPAATSPERAPADASQALPAAKPPPAVREKSPTTPSPPPGPDVAPSAERERDDLLAWLELTAALGSALDHGPVRVGGELGGRLSIPTVPLFASMSFAFSETAGTVGGVRASWMEGFVGLGHRQALGDSWWLQSRVEGFAQRLTASVSVGADEAPSDGDRWLGGARVGADIAWWPWKTFGFVIGATGSWTSGTTDIEVRGERVASSTPFAYGVRGGIAYGIP